MSSVGKQKPRGLFKTREDLNSLDELLKVQLRDGNWNYDDYMVGLTNGMILSRHVVADDPGEPAFRRAPTLEDARQLRDTLGPAYADISLAQLWQGIMAELKEHGDTAGDLDVIPGRGSEEWLTAARIAASHLLENPIYYTEIKKIEEFTIYDLQKRVNQVIKRTAGERRKIKGVMERGLQFVNFDPLLGIAYFLAEPTRKFSADELDFQGNPKGATSAYTLEVRFVDFKSWFEDWRKVTLEEFKDFLKVCDVQFFCSCPAWHFMLKYQNTQTNTAIYKTNIPDPVWAQRSGQPRGANLCKHGMAMTTKLTRYPGQLLKDIQSKLK